MRETWVRSMDREDLLEKEKATHSGTLAWKIPWTEKPGRLQSMESQRVGQDWATSLSLSPWTSPASSFSNSVSSITFYSGLQTENHGRFLFPPPFTPSLLANVVGSAFLIYLEFDLLQPFLKWMTVIPCLDSHPGLLIRLPASPVPSQWSISLGSHLE